MFGREANGFCTAQHLNEFRQWLSRLSTTELSTRCCTFLKVLSAHFNNLILTRSYKILLLVKAPNLKTKGSREAQAGVFTTQPESCFGHSPACAAAVGTHTHTCTLAYTCTDTNAHLCCRTLYIFKAFSDKCLTTRGLF